MKIDLIIPVFNESETIEKVLKEVPTGLFARVIVVDNMSTDGTGDLAKGMGATVVREEMRGYGAVCLRGMEIAGEDGVDAVAFLDGDLSDDGRCLAELIEAMKCDSLDLVIGSRAELAEAGSMTGVQKFGNLLSCFLIRVCTGERFSDLGPMRVIRWEAIERMGMIDRTWGWTVEMQYKAGAMGMRCGEMDVPYRVRGGGESKISGTVMGSVKAGYKILTTIGKLRLTMKHVKRKR